MKTKYLLLLFSLAILTSCGSKKKTVYTKPKSKTNTSKSTPVTANEPRETEVLKSTSTTKVYTEVVQDYINEYKEIAKQQMLQYGVPASITLAQGILESGAGRGELVLKANNHFGIKCHDWKGLTVYHDDDREGECFRKYAHPHYSYQDHSLFLTGRKRYLFLFKLPKDDYKSWAKGLRQAGYATDPRYPQKLIGLIDRYKLYEFDAEVLGKSLKDAKKVTSNTNKYTVVKGDTLYSISRRYKLTVDELKQINSLEDNNIYEGQVLFIKPLESNY
ncbi:glucosaminidase domain-containing protein [Abyssalbus ytuae]|uniref:Peptidoglycan hydrolase n=1 Tax=Abyssalbus ytuae TaxID=2926907 RepID=A0A9E7CTR9_9FLAO|nr:glucosaminidase domain-containing protein [Abyssalbus ytuae]UOB18551.1 glucosaminidase domain-containing protein [Abyssalbus ytuae]